MDTKANPTPMDTSNEDGKKRYPGRPLQVVKVEETGDEGMGRKICVDQENLDIVINNIKKTGVNKMMTVSLVGAMRTGKSFMLDLFLRYLTDPASSQHSSTPEVVFEGINMNDEKDSQFYWRAHSERTTTGIWFYSHPFVRTIQGSKVCVVLMDTQGLFDPMSPPDVNKAIFALSVLLSSFQILNVQNRIQEDTLNQLDYFSHFAQSAMRLLIDSAADKDANPKSTDDEVGDLGIHKFQNLHFLVRDWANFDDDEDVEANIKQTNSVLEHAMKSHFDDEGQRDRIKNSFEQVKAFFLPHPGLKVIKKNWDGELQKCDPGFRKMTGHFLRYVFDDSLVVKKDMVSGDTLTPNNLKHYTSAFVEMYASGKMPDSMTLFQAISKATTLGAKEKALETYKAIMDKKAGPNSSYIKNDVLKKHSQYAFDKARQEFAKIAAFGEKKQREDALEAVMSKLEREWVAYEEANRNRVDKIFAGYATMAVIAGAAFILDTLSDYTCDWWSQTCVQGSKLAKYVYSLIFLIIGTQVFLLYQDDGQIVMFKALAGLWAAATSKAIEYYNQLRNSEIAKELGFDSVMDLASGATESKKKTGKTSRKRSKKAN